MNRNERRILGIDPGFGRIGYAVLSAQGLDLHLVVCNAIVTPTTLGYPQRLQQIYEELGMIMAEYQPTEAAIEALFFGRNVITFKKILLLETQPRD